MITGSRGVQADHRLAQRGRPRRRAAAATRDADLEAVPADAGARRAASPAPMRCATSVLGRVGDRQRHHEHQRDHVDGDLVAGHRRRADARDEERHEGEAGHLDQDRQAHRHAEAQQRRAGWPRSGRREAAAAGRSGDRTGRGAAPRPRRASWHHITIAVAMPQPGDAERRQRAAERRRQRRRRPAARRQRHLQRQRRRAAAPSPPSAATRRC